MTEVPPAGEHDCHYPEILITEAAADDNLHVGMRVLIPCPICGETPLDAMGMLDYYRQEADDALLAVEPCRMLYHWAPTTRRKQILRYGLRPRMRPVTSSGDPEDRQWRPRVICLGDSPSWAWALSGAMSYTPAGEWDLWQTSLDRLLEPVVLASNARASGIHEVRTEHRIFKRDLWYVATRAKP